jgi:hypothetical protein
VTNLMLSLMRDLAAYTIDRGHGFVGGILWKLTLLLPVVVSQWMTTALNKALERPRTDFTSILSSGLASEYFDLRIKHFVGIVDLLLAKVTIEYTRNMSIEMTIGQSLIPC